MSATAVLMCRRQVNIDAEQAKKAAMAERKARIAEITAAWRSGFAALKAENDRMQSEMNAWYKEKVHDIGQEQSERLADCEELR